MPRRKQKNLSAGKGTMAKARSRRLIWLVPPVLFIMVAIYFFMWANKSVSTRPPTAAVQGASTTIAFKSFETQYFQTQIPSTLVVKSQPTTQGGGVLLQQFLSNQATSINTPIADQVAITVRQQTDEGVNGLSDVQFRNKNPSKYRSSDLDDSASADAIEFISSINGYEKSIFWCEKQRCVSLVVSGTSDRIEKLDETITRILSSWQWKY